MLKNTGVPDEKDLASVTPTKKRLEEGPVVVVECFQEIPCDPCHYSCPKDAIKPFKDINHLPEVDFQLCNGCGICIASCPGLAIFIIEKNYSDDEASIMMPYELSPLPAKGDLVQTLDRSGNAVGLGKIEEVRITKKQDRTAVIKVVVPKEDVMRVRHFKLRRPNHG